MKRATISIPDDLDAALEAYRRDQDVPPALAALAQAALKEYLAQRGYLASERRLRVTPASEGSGHTDISLNHDHYLAGR